MLRVGTLACQMLLAEGLEKRQMKWAVLLACAMLSWALLLQRRRHARRPVAATDDSEPSDPYATPARDRLRRCGR